LRQFAGNSSRKRKPSKAQWTPELEQSLESGEGKAMECEVLERMVLHRQKIWIYATSPHPYSRVLISVYEEDSYLWPGKSKSMKD
jgi:hypothetical protein